MPLPPSLAEIAARAGVSTCTVSYALRDHPRVAPATGERIRRLAAALGYRPNPLTRALLTGIRTRHLAPTGTALAYLIDYSDPREMKRNVVQRRLLDGAHARADALGYTLEVHALRTRGLSSARLAGLLQARGIHGLILAPTHDAQEPVHLDLPWEQFAAVHLGFSRHEPVTHRVANFQFHSIRLAFDHLWQLGYRRIGLSLDPRLDERFDRSWHAGFIAASHQHLQVPADSNIFGLDPDSVRGDFLAWVQRFGPDAILSTRPTELHALREAGWRVPEDVGFAVIKLDGRDAEVAGVDQREDLIGATGVELVAQQLNQNQLGTPDLPMTVMIEGVWVTGATVRPTGDSTKLS